MQGLIDALLPLRALRRFRDRYMLKTAAGARYDKMFRAHSLELSALSIDNKPVRDAGAALLRIAGRFFNAKDEVLARKIAKEDLAETDKALAVVRKPASPRLKAAIDTAVADLKRLKGKPLTAAFQALDTLEAGVKTKQRGPSAVSAVAKRATRPKKVARKTAKKRRG